MWILNATCTFAENKETGETLRCDYRKDGLIRVKKKYKTISTFRSMSDAQVFLTELVKKLNGGT